MICQRALPSGSDTEMVLAFIPIFIIHHLSGKIKSGSDTAFQFFDRLYYFLSF